MKRSTFLAVILLPAICAGADTLSLEEVSPHFPKDAQIIWKAPTNNLPKMLWTYQKQPTEFSANVVSNALALGEFQIKPFPKSLTKEIIIWDKAVESDPQPDYFSMLPEDGIISFRRERHPVSKGEASASALVNRARQYASQLGMESKLLARKEYGGTNPIIAFCRKIDGIAFRDETEGFSINYGLHGEICFFSMAWPKLAPLRQENLIRDKDFVRCIRAFKTPVIPRDDEPDYRARVKALSHVKSLTITNIAIYYSEGPYGEQPSGAASPRFVGPVAVLDGIADWGKSNEVVQLYSPLTATDVSRLLRAKNSSKEKKNR